MTAGKIHLGDVIEINPEAIGSDFPFLEIQYVEISAVGSGSLDVIKLISLENAPSRAKRLVNHGDTILSTVRPNRRSFLFVKNPPKNLVASTGFAVLRPTDAIDPRYLYCLIRHQEFTDYLTNNAKGAAYPAIDKDIISRAEISLPSLPIQCKIAAILSAYDDLIENNTRRIKILEVMAQAIYREWFVHVRFPGYENMRMVDSGTKLGKVPDEWEIKHLGEIGEVITGKTPSKKVPDYWDNNDIQFIRTPDMHDQIYCISTNDYLSNKGAESQKNKYLPPNSLCVSCIGTVGIVTITSVIAQTNQQINSIILNQSYDLEFLYFALQDLQETMHQHGASGATMSNLSKGKFMALEIIYPQRELRSKFHEIASTMFDEIKNLQYRNANLIGTRDLLLPKLLSGEIDLSYSQTQLIQEN